MRAGQLHQMEEAFNEFPDGDTQANVITYNAQIIGYASAVEKMEKAGSPINATVGEILIQVYSRMKQFEKMEGVMKIMNDIPGVQYDSRLLSMVIKSYGNNGKLDEMESAIIQNKRIFSTPKSLHAFKPSLETHYLIDVYEADGNKNCITKGM